MPCNDAFVLLGIFQPLVIPHAQDVKHVNVLIKIQIEVLMKMLIHSAVSNRCLKSTALVLDRLT